MVAKYVGKDKELWKRTLTNGSTHKIYLTSYDTSNQEGWISIDEETYPVTLHELINEWEVIDE